MTTATTRTSTAYEQLISHIQDMNLIRSTGSLLGWDQEVFMPRGGLEYRARQLSYLAKLQHSMITDPRVQEWLGVCEADDAITSDPTSPQAVNVRELRRTVDRQSKLPAELVEQEAQLASVGQATWAEARRNKNFKEFLPVLEQVIDLLRNKAKCYGWESGGEPWDALAEDYEPGCTAADVRTVFTPLRERLQTLLDDIAGAAQKPGNAFNELPLPIEQQQKFVRFVSETFGFDYTRGRLDLSTHPFCSGTHCNDVRLTTRFRDHNVNDALGSTMHETGHGLYEQGLPTEHIGSPMGESVSLGIHESQSRMWENQVGRSIAFWKWCFPKLGEFFGDAVAGLSFEDVYGGANIVQPGFIRVEADEATYNMHIMIRFELETMMLNGTLDAADVPDAWNTRYKEYLGIDMPDDALGCLQDIHWSMTAMGYFPTYTLGNLYAAQFFECAKQQIPDLDAQFERGQFGSLLTWLNENIHAHGQRYRAADLCEHVTGKPLSADPLMRHLEGKLRPLYGI